MGAMDLVARAGHQLGTRHVADARWKVKMLWYHLQAVVTICVVTVAVGMLLFNRGPVVEALSITFVGAPVSPGGLPLLVAGGPARVKWVVREIIPNCDGDIYPLWVDSEGTVFDDPPEPVPKRVQPGSDGKENFGRPRNPPTGMALGEAVFAPKAIRWCNVLQHYVWPIRDNSLPRVKFIVVARP